MENNMENAMVFIFFTQIIIFVFIIIIIFGVKCELKPKLYILCLYSEHSRHTGLRESPKRAAEKVNEEERCNEQPGIYQP